jgi:O-antigen/teichoic acid export membrane protein
MLIKSYFIGVFTILFDILFYYIFFKEFDQTVVGIYSDAISYAMVILLFVDASSVQMLIRRGVQFGAVTKGYVGLLYKIKKKYILLGVFIYALTVIATEKISFLYIIILLYMLINYVDTVYVNLFRVYSKQNISNIFLLINSIFKFSVFIIIIQFFEVTVNVLVIGLLVSKLCYILLIYLYVLINNFQFITEDTPEENVISEQKSVRDFTLISFTSFIENRLDWLLIGYFFSPVQLALYALSNKVFEITRSLTGIGLTNIYPLLCASNNRASKYYKVIFSGSLIIFVIIYFNIDTIIFSFNQDYIEAVSLIKYFMLVAPLSVLVGISYQYMLVHKLENKILKISYISILIQSIINLFLLEQFGIKIAIFSMSIMWITMLTFHLLALYKVDKSIKPDIFFYLILLIMFYILVY